MQQTAVLDSSVAAASRRRSSARAGTDLVSIAAPVLEIVMQLRAGQIRPSNDLRRTVDGLLKQMEQRGAQLRYSHEQIQAVKFALAAFVDETVLTADFPLRDVWEKNPLQLEYFSEHLAGIKFFDRLNDMLTRAEAEVDVIEVYYLCLLLGYKGKYRIYLEDQLKGVIQNVADHLRRLNRLQSGELSPHWRATDQPELPKDPGTPLWVKLGGGAALVLLVFVYLIFYLLLESNVRDALGRSAY